MDLQKYRPKYKTKYRKSIESLNFCGSVNFLGVDKLRIQGGHFLKSALNRVLTLADYSTRREFSIDVLYVTRASIYAELRLKQVRMQIFENTCPRRL